MIPYHKIQTIYFRDMQNNRKDLLEGQWSLPEFEYLANNPWQFSEKVDGTSIRLMFDGVDLRFGGRTDNAQLPSKLVDRLRERFPNQELFLEHFDGPVCLYG